MRNRTIFVALSFLVAASTFAAAADDAYTTWQLDFRDVPVTVAQDVIDRTLGSGSIDLVAGQELLERLKGLPMQTATRDWFDQHPDAAVYGGVPFYGPRNLPVATEYYMQCGDNICGAIYDVFPTATTTDEAMDLIRRGSHCLDAYYCDTGSNPGSFSLKTFLVP